MALVRAEEEEASQRDQAAALVPFVAVREDEVEARREGGLGTTRRSVVRGSAGGRGGPGGGSDAAEHRSWQCGTMR